MKILTSCIATTVVYFVTFILSALIFAAITHQPIDLARKSSGIVIGSCLLVLPYVFNGFLSRKLFLNPVKGALTSSLILVFSERLLIYLIGLYFVIRGAESPLDHRPVLMFIQGEAAPYFTLPYILLGLISIALCVLIARGKRPFSSKMA